MVLVVVENLGMRFCLALDLHQTFRENPYVARLVVSVESKEKNIYGGKKRVIVVMSGEGERRGEEG